MSQSCNATRPAMIDLKHCLDCGEWPCIYYTKATIDAARSRVVASGKPTLQELRDKFSGWDAPELSGKVVMRNPKESA